LLASVQFVHAERVSEGIKEAEKIMDRIDIDDVPFVALVLSFPNDGIWTEDKHFLKQRRVKVWRARELLRLLREQGQSY